MATRYGDEAEGSANLLSAPSGPANPARTARGGGCRRGSVRHRFACLPCCGVATVAQRVRRVARRSGVEGRQWRKRNIPPRPPRPTWTRFALGRVERNRHARLHPPSRASEHRSRRGKLPRRRRPAGAPLRSRRPHRGGSRRQRIAAGERPAVRRGGRRGDGRGRRRRPVARRARVVARRGVRRDERARGARERRPPRQRREAGVVHLGGGEVRDGAGHRRPHEGIRHPRKRRPDSSPAPARCWPQGRSAPIPSPPSASPACASIAAQRADAGLAAGPSAPASGSDEPLRALGREERGSSSARDIRRGCRSCDGCRRHALGWKRGGRPRRPERLGRRRSRTRRAVAREIDAALAEARRRCAAAPTLFPSPLRDAVPTRQHGASRASDGASAAAGRQRPPQRNLPLPSSPPIRSAEACALVDEDAPESLDYRIWNVAYADGTSVRL